MADEPKVKVQGERVPSRGAQVILTGEAQDAARGGMGPDIADNVVVKEALEADGTIADGYSVDGSTRTGKPAPDVVVEADGEVPAEEGSTRVEAPPKPEPAKRVPKA